MTSLLGRNESPTTGLYYFIQVEYQGLEIEIRRTQSIALNLEIFFHREKIYGLPQDYEHDISRTSFGRT